MKIAFLSFYSGHVYRGVETFVHEVANQLVMLGHDVTIFQNSQQIKGSKYKTITIGLSVNWNQKANHFPYLNYYARQVRTFTAKALLLMASDTQIVFPTNGQWQSLLCKIWTAKNKAKLVISGQSGPGRDDRLNLYTFPDVFISLTNTQVAWAKRVNPFVKTIKIPNGVDLNKFGSKSNKIKIDLPKPIILSVGAFDDSKRLDLVIKAVSRLDQISLLLVGNGQAETKLRILAQKVLPGRCQFLSFPHDQMPGVYSCADIFTYATVPWESFGIVLVEAMASGLPVVATDDPIRREIIGDAGLFVNPENTQDYARALKKALNTDWGDKPRKQAEKFSWDKIAKDYEALFKSL